MEFKCHQRLFLNARLALVSLEMSVTFWRRPRDGAVEVSSKSTYSSALPVLCDQSYRFAAIGVLVLGGNLTQKPRSCENPRLKMRSCVLSLDIKLKGVIHWYKTCPQYANKQPTLVYCKIKCYVGTFQWSIWHPGGSWRLEVRFLANPNAQKNMAHLTSPVKNTKLCNTNLKREDFETSLAYHYWLVMKP